MKTTKKSIPLVITALILCFALAACSSGAADSQSASESGASQSSEAASTQSASSDSDENASSQDSSSEGSKKKDLVGAIVSDSDSSSTAGGDNRMADSFIAGDSSDTSGSESGWVDVDAEYCGTYQVYLSADNDDKVIVGEGSLSIDGSAYTIDFTPFDSNYDSVRTEGKFFRYETAESNYYVGTSGIDKSVYAFFYPESGSISLTALEAFGAEKNSANYYYTRPLGEEAPMIDEAYCGTYNVARTVLADAEGNYSDVYGTGTVEISRNQVTVNFNSEDGSVPSVNARISFYKTYDEDDVEFSVAGVSTCDGYHRVDVFKEFDTPICLWFDNDEEAGSSFILVLG